MKSALHSISYGGVWAGQARLDMEGVFDRAAELGFDGILLAAKRPHLSALDFDAAACAEMRKRIHARGLEVSALAAYTDFTANPERPDVPTSEMQAVAIRRLGELASELECPIVRVFTGYEREGLSADRAWATCVEWLRECSRQVAPLGVTIAVQNHHDIGVHFETMRALLGEVDEPNCQAGFDAWNLMELDVDEYDAAVTMAPLTALTIVADYVTRPRFRYRPDLVSYEADQPKLQAVPFGEGEVDYVRFFQGLWEGGYDGPVAYEMCSPLEGGGSLSNLDRYARTFLSRIQEMAPSSAAAPTS